MALATVMGLFASCAPKNADGQQPFDLNLIASRTEATVGYSDTQGKDVLNVESKSGAEGIVIWETGDTPSWTDAKYLVVETLDKATWSGTINLEFYKDMKNFVSEQVVLQGGEISGTTEDTPWISCLFGVLPNLPTKIVFPLSYLDAQQIFLERFPRQLKGTVSGNRLDPADIVKVVLRFGPDMEGYYDTPYEIASITLMNDKPEPYPALDQPIIDVMGQSKVKDYPGKMSSVEEMIEKSNAQLNEDVTFPKDWGKFGGWKGKKFQATGYFRTQHDGKRWWLVDPEGYAFLSVGVDCVRSNSEGPVTGIEDLFDWLPEVGDETFAAAIGRERNGLQPVDFYISNLIRAYGADWKEKWVKVTANQMRKLRVNTVGNWSEIEFARAAQIPYVMNMNAFPSTAVAIYRDFPDVFAEEYTESARKFAAQLEPLKDDPYLVGYFLRNEPQWAFGYHNLAYEMFATDQQSETKTAFVKWIQERYPDVKALNDAWAISLNSFDELSTQTYKEYPSETAKNDFNDFSMIMVKRYVDVPCDEVDKVDNHHMNLGMRYAWLSSDLLYKAGERFDVFSINGYGLQPPPTAEIAQRSGKPVMIGEFHHGAVDRALPATGIVGVMNQQERADAYRNYIEQGMARPEVVGLHYFQWVDQPYYGRFDGENYNIGIVTQVNTPYQELGEGMILTNERLYDVATGKVEPFKANIVPTPYIHY